MVQKNYLSEKVPVKVHIRLGKLRNELCKLLIWLGYLQKIKQPLYLSSTPFHRFWISVSALFNMWWKYIKRWSLWSSAWLEIIKLRIMKAQTHLVWLTDAFALWTSTLQVGRRLACNCLVKFQSSFTHIQKWFNLP